MFKPLSLFIGLRYATVRRGSELVSFLSGVSILGLSLGVGLLVVVLAVMSGFDKELRSRILAMVPQASVHSWEPIEDWRELATDIAQMDGVVAVAPFIKVQGMLIKGRQAHGVELTAVDYSLEKSVSVLPQFMVQGEFDNLQQANALVLSEALAKKLKLALGDSVALVLPGNSSRNKISPQATRFTLVATFETATEIDNAAGYINLASGQKLQGYNDAVTGLQLKVDDLMAARVISRNVLYQLPRGFYTRDWTVTHGNLFEAIQMSKKLVSLLLFIIIAVAAFNVVTALFMVVNDKQADIAIWQTMGLTPAQVMRVFLIQGLFIGVVGTGFGVAFGVGLALSVTDLVAGLESLIGYQFLKAEIYPVTYLPADIRWRDVLTIAAVSLGLSVVAAIYPAWRASKLPPAEILRYDR